MRRMMMVEGIMLSILHHAQPCIVISGSLQMRSVQLSLYASCGFLSALAHLPSCGFVQEAAKEHDSCINNLHTSLTAIGHPLTDDPDHYLPPSPFNLWMAVSLKNEGSQLSWDPPAKVVHALLLHQIVAC